MPLTISQDLPAVGLLEEENIRVADDGSAKLSCDRPLRLLLLNLMPLKIATETDLIRLLSNSPLPVELTLLHIKEHQSKNTSREHIEAFYRAFDEVKEERFDGFIVTGAPVEHLPFEEVSYWSQIRQIFDWSRENVTSTLYICWAAQAALYHFYGVPKYPLAKKQFGIFAHRINNPLHPLLRGFDDQFFVPHSRHTEVRREDILAHPELELLSESEEAGVYLVSPKGRREFFISGHSEYAPSTLDTEYRRDLSKGLDIEVPKNYYRGDNPDNSPMVWWRAHANLLFTNWLTHYVNRKQ